MKLFESLVRFIKGNFSLDTKETPEDFCPNCWGRYEYAGQFYEAVKNHNIDVNSKNPNVGWVQDYANKHLLDIALQQDGSNMVCQKCKVSFKVSEK